jgi:hypothetical protein
MLRRGHSFRVLELTLCRVVTSNTMPSVSRSSLCDFKSELFSSVGMMGVRALKDESIRAIPHSDESKVKTLRNISYHRQSLTSRPLSVYDYYSLPYQTGMNPNFGPYSAV